VAVSAGSIGSHIVELVDLPWSATSGGFDGSSVTDATDSPPPPPHRIRGAASELRRERVLHSLQSGNPSSGAIVDTNAHVDSRDEVAPVQLASDHVWHRNVRQWGPDWLEYDEYYRPVVLNPYRAAVRIVYIYQRAPRIVVIPPLARIVLEVAEIGAYSFTAVVLNAVNTAANVAVGASSAVAISRVPGCRYRRLHRRCCAMTTSPSWCVTRRRCTSLSRVQRIIDVGDDVRFGERKVLLDGATPVWGRGGRLPPETGNSRCTEPSSSRAWIIRKRRRCRATTH
jgi:hypothetical protein